MAPFKDALYTAVWSHLRSMPKYNTLFTALNHPISGSQNIRSSWSTLKSDGRDEGVKKTTGLQSVLAERPDIFCFTTTDRGHQLIGLTEGAQAMDPSGGIPPNIVNPNGGIQDLCFTTVNSSLCETVAMLPPLNDVGDSMPLAMPLDPLFDALPSLGTGTGPMAVPPLTMLALPLGTVQAFDRPKQQKGFKGKGKLACANVDSAAHGGLWNGYCFTDIIWTPELMQKKSLEKIKQCQLVRALYRAMDMHAGQSVSLSQLGSDFKVAELKKDPFFKNWRLLDILKEHENVFELTPATGVTGGMTVKLQPGAEAALPDADSAGEMENDAELLLPERIENPRDIKEKIQSLRIELLYALHRRGGKVAIQELGQEPRVQKVKSEIKHQKKFNDWVKIFPENFKTSVGSGAMDGQMVVEIGSTEVYDQSMIDKAIGRVVNDKPPNDNTNNNTNRRAAKGGSSGGNSDRRDRDHKVGKDRPRARSRSRDRDRRPADSSAYGPPSYPTYPSSAYPPMSYPGYASSTSAYGYGMPPAQPLVGGYSAYPGYPPVPGYPPAGTVPPAGQAPPGYPPAGCPPPAGYPPGTVAIPNGYPPPLSGGAPGYPPPCSVPPGCHYPPPASGAPGYPPPGSAPLGYPSHASAAPGYAPPPSSMGYPPPPGAYPPATGYPSYR